MPGRVRPCSLVNPSEMAKEICLDYVFQIQIVLYVLDFTPPWERVIAYIFLDGLKLRAIYPDI